MPSLWKKQKGNRISRLVADLQTGPKRGGSLVVETGFPTSLIDQFVKNRDKLKKPKSKHHKSKKKMLMNNTVFQIFPRNNECPACRKHCASRRSLRDDPNYDALIAALYPDIDRYEEEELAFQEDERVRNKQVKTYSSRDLAFVLSYMHVDAGVSPAAFVGTSEILAWGRGGLRSSTRYGSGNGGNVKHSRGRFVKLTDYFRTWEQNESELDIQVVLVSLDEQKELLLEHSYLCGRPALSVGQICEFISHQTSLPSDKVEILGAKGSSLSSTAFEACKDELQVLNSEETLAGLKASSNFTQGHLMLAYRKKLLRSFSLEFEEFRGFKISADALRLFMSEFKCLSYLNRNFFSLRYDGFGKCQTVFSAAEIECKLGKPCPANVGMILSNV
uniref:Uncharacterized protein n=1 Tax=Chenopodium quinoa TaxID=63459 RepID=A0A803LLK2_CHEQI